MKRFLLLPVFIAALLTGCSRGPVPPDAVVRVGDRWVDSTELQRSYVLQPRWKRGQTRLASYLAQTSELITQKVMALEAEGAGLDKDSEMVAYLQFLRDKELIKGLYENEIRGRVTVTDDEIRSMYVRSKKKVTFAYVFSADSAHCALYRRELAGADSVVTVDPQVRVGVKENVVIGDLAAELERVVFSAGLHEICGPMHVANGYILVKITGGEQQAFMSDNEMILQRKKLEKVISGRKADSLSSHFVATLMRDKDLRLNAPVFWGVADVFFRRVQESQIDRQGLHTVYITGDELRQLGGDLGATGNAVVATYKDGTLTVHDLLTALSAMPGGLRPRVRTPQNLKDAIGGIVRNRYLLKEAERRGLGNDPAVRNEVRMRNDEALAEAYYTYRRSGINVTPAEAQAYARTSGIAEEQVFFKVNMQALARDAKLDSVIAAELPALRVRYECRCDTAKIRSMIPAPDEVLQEDPIRLFVREVFM